MLRIHGQVAHVEHDPETEQWTAVLSTGERHVGDAVVLAAGPDATPKIIAASKFGTSTLATSKPATSTLTDTAGPGEWQRSIENVSLAPAFAVLRMWFDGEVNENRPAFLGTAEFGMLDNVTVLERFEAGAAAWTATHHGSVVELHAYALPDGFHGEPAKEQELVSLLRAELTRVYPETEQLGVVAQELLIERDCALIGVEPWDERPTVATPHPGLTLAGDWVRCELPIALMERAATTGWMAANQLLAGWGVAGHELWSVPTKGRHWWPRVSRSLMKKLPGARTRA